MMKGLKLLVVLLLVTSNCISQIGTTKDSTVCLPKKVAVQIIQDLEAGDRSRQEIVVLKDIISDSETIITTKDSIISELTKKEDTYKSSMLEHSNIFKEKDSIIKLNEEKFKKVKKQNFFLKIGIGVLATFLILK